MAGRRRTRQGESHISRSSSTTSTHPEPSHSAVSNAPLITLPRPIRPRPAGLSERTRAPPRRRHRPRQSRRSSRTFLSPCDTEERSAAVDGPHVSPPGRRRRAGSVRRSSARPQPGPALVRAARPSERARQLRPASRRPACGKSTGRDCEPCCATDKAHGQCHAPTASRSTSATQSAHARSTHPRAALPGHASCAREPSAAQATLQHPHRTRRRLSPPRARRPPAHALLAAEAEEVVRILGEL